MTWFTVVTRSTPTSPLRAVARFRTLDDAHAMAEWLRSMGARVWVSWSASVEMP